MSKFVVEKIKDFDLNHIFDCGQCFRWERQKDGSYTGVAQGKVVNMQFDRGTLTIDHCTEEEFQTIWKPYLDLDRDYGKIKTDLAHGDPIMTEATAFGSGIRILKQDLWETIVSFIISQNNNIPRIKGCIENLARLFGSSAGEYEGRAFYNLPGPDELARLGAGDLAAVSLGYRARYLIAAAKKICEEGMPEDEESLLSLCGVGPKVADCILLFGMGKYDSFPIDVWVCRVMSQLYGIKETDKKAMTAYAREHFGDLGGFAQQYLFYYIRDVDRK